MSRYIALLCYATDGGGGGGGGNASQIFRVTTNDSNKRKDNTDISQNAQHLALFQSPSDRKQIGIIAECMFDKNRIHFVNAYYKETKKPFGYLLSCWWIRKPDTPAVEQVLADLFREWYVCHFGLKSPVVTKPKTHFAKKVNSTTTKTTSSRKLQTVTSPGPMQIFLSSKDTPQEHRQSVNSGRICYHRNVQHNASRNETHQRQRGGVLINGENYWPTIIKETVDTQYLWSQYGAPPF